MGETESGSRNTTRALYGKSGIVEGPFWFLSPITATIYALSTIHLHRFVGRVGDICASRFRSPGA